MEQSLLSSAPILLPWQADLLLADCVLYSQNVFRTDASTLLALRHELQKAQSIVQIKKHPSPLARDGLSLCPVFVKIGISVSKEKARHKSAHFVLRSQELSNISAPGDLSWNQWVCVCIHLCFDLLDNNSC